MRKDKQFTLVELLAVVVIITILATILIGGVTYAMKKADVSKTQAQLQKLEMALEAFKAEKGYYPPCGTDKSVRFGIYDDKEVLVLGSHNDVDDIENRFLLQSKSGKLFIDLPFEKIQTGNPPKDYTDAWDNAFKYKCKGTHNPQKYDLWSTGADGTDGTDDDITNW